MSANEFGVLTAPDTVRIERLLPGPIQRVWSYLVEPEKRGRWLATGPMELRAGGNVELVFHNNRLTGHDDPPPADMAPYGGEHRMRCQITACEPVTLLAMSWGEGEGASHVRFDLSELGSQVRLVVTHSRLAAREGMVLVSGGWHTHLGVLIDLLNERQPDSFWVTFAARRADYEQRIPQRPQA